jgi:ATP-binding cassette subfamily C (CFTR/MRP) protein 1
MMAFLECLNDDTFGPAVYGCRDNFDFTLTFEKIFLSLLPASLFIVSGQTRIIFLARRPRIVKGSLLWNLKLV